MVDVAWVEKYRPKTIDDVSSQEHTVAVLRKTLQSTNVSLTFIDDAGTQRAECEN